MAWSTHLQLLAWARSCMFFEFDESVVIVLRRLLGSEICSSHGLSRHINIQPSSAAWFGIARDPEFPWIRSSSVRPNIELKSLQFGADRRSGVLGLSRSGASM